MKWKHFLKPNWRKILITILVYLFVEILLLPIIFNIIYLFLFYFIFYIFISYLIACLLENKIKSLAIKEASFLKPDQRKITLFIILFLIFPWPSIFIVDPGGLRLEIIPLTAPLLFIASILAIILNSKFYHPFNLLLLFNLSSPFIIYLLSCIILFIWNKIKMKLLRKNNLNF